MKNIILLINIFTILTITTLSSQAQSVAIKQENESVHKIELGLSDGLPVHIAVGFADAFGTIFGSMANAFVPEGQRYKLKESESSNFPLFVNANYWNQVSNRIHIGAGISYLALNRDEIYEKESDPNNRIHTGRSLKMMILQAKFRYDYLQRNNFTLYGNIGAGILTSFNTYTKSGESNKHDSYNIFAFQVNPIGFEFGNKIGGFLEAGFAYQGIIEAGMFVKF